MKQELRATDIQNITWRNSEYGIGNATHTFVCNVDNDILTITYDLYRHDDGYGFTIHTKPVDIWDKMERNELEKLDVILEQAAKYGSVMKRLHTIDNADDLDCFKWDLIDMELNISDEQRDNLWNEIHKMEEVLE